MSRTTLRLAVPGIGLAFILGCAAGPAAAESVGVGSAPAQVTTQCNSDPGMDASNDPVHCHYNHPKQSWEHYGYPEQFHHHHHHDR